MADDFSDLIGKQTMKSAILHLPTLAAVAEFTSKDETRRYLGGVCIEVDADGVTYVATDGNRLAARRIALPEDAAANALTGQWIIPAAECRAIKINRKIPDAVLTEADGWLDIGYMGLLRRFKPVEGTFPDWRRIVPLKADEKLTCGINGDYLAGVQKFAKVLDLGFVTAHWNNGEACAFSFSDDAGAFALVMPIRQKVETPWSRPKWLTETAPAA